MQANKSSLSVGEIIRELLLSSEDVAAITRHIFPVMIQTSAELPYIVYSRTGLNARSVKEHRSSDEVEVEVACYTGRYDEGIRLAEAVRAAIDGCQAEYGDLFMSKCILTSASEGYSADAFVQYLVFNIKVQ